MVKQLLGYIIGGLCSLLFLSILQLTPPHISADGPIRIPTTITEEVPQLLDSDKSRTIQQSILVKKIVPNLIKLLFYLASSLGVVSLIYGGFLILTSLGEADRVKQGTSIIVYTVIGIIIMFLSRAIVGLIENVRFADGHFNPFDVWIDDSQHLGNLQDGNIITGIIPTLIGTLMSILSLIIIGMLIYAGFLYVTSTGSESMDDNRSKANTIFIDAIIGIVVILTSYIFITALLRINYGG